MFLSALQVFFIVNTIKKIWGDFYDQGVLTPRIFQLTRTEILMYNCLNISKIREKIMEEKVFHAGGVEFHVDNRNLGEDGGPSVRVFSEADSKNIQLLRFDCFRKNPHYHYDPSGKNDHRNLDKVTVLDSVAWTIEQLGQNLVEMINTAGYTSIAEQVDQAAVTKILPEIESLMRGEN